MRIDARYQGGSTRLRALIDHPMETGTRQDATGVSIPPLFIQSLVIRYQEKVVVDAKLSSAISRNPYFSFEFTGGNIGDELTIEWVDSADNQSEKTVVIA